MEEKPHLVIGVFQYFVKENEIEDAVGKLDEVKKVEILVDEFNGKSIGIAYITLKDPNNVKMVFDYMKTMKGEEFIGGQQKMKSEQLMVKEYDEIESLQFIIDNGDFSYTSSVNGYRMQLTMKQKEKTKIGDDKPSGNDGRINTTSTGNKENDRIDSKDYRDRGRDREWDRERGRGRGRSDSRHRHSRSNSRGRRHKSRGRSRDRHRSRSRGRRYDKRRNYY